jgi:hypothetical protein
VGPRRVVDGPLLLVADPAWAGAIDTVLVKDLRRRRPDSSGFIRNPSPAGLMRLMNVHVPAHGGD